MTHVCPACKGEPPKPAIAFVNTGEDWRKHYQTEVLMKCRVCNQTGAVDDHVFKRWHEGKAHREARVERGEYLFHAARRMGIKATELSNYEFGFADLPEQAVSQLDKQEKQ